MSPKEAGLRKRTTRGKSKENKGDPKEGKAGSKQSGKKGKTAISTRAGTSGKYLSKIGFLSSQKCLILLMKCLVLIISLLVGFVLVLKFVVPQTFPCDMFSANSNNNLLVFFIKSFATEYMKDFREEAYPLYPVAGGHDANGSNHPDNSTTHKSDLSPAFLQLLDEVSSKVHRQIIPPVYFPLISVVAFFEKPFLETLVSFLTPIFYFAIRYLYSDRRFVPKEYARKSHDLHKVSITVRSRFYDLALSRDIYKYGMSQVVHVGAGLDTKLFKILEIEDVLKESGASKKGTTMVENPSNVRIFEMDLPHAVSVRRCLIGTLGRSDQINTYGCDLNDYTVHGCVQSGGVLPGASGPEGVGGVSTRLFQFDPSRPATFIEEATFMYIGRGRRVQLLKDLFNSAACGSRFHLYVLCYQTNCATPIPFTYAKPTEFINHNVPTEWKNASYYLNSDYPSTRDYPPSGEQPVDEPEVIYNEDYFVPSGQRQAIKDGLLKAIEENISGGQGNAETFSLFIFSLRMTAPLGTADFLQRLGIHSDIFENEFAGSSGPKEILHGFTTVVKEC